MCATIRSVYFPRNGTRNVSFNKSSASVQVWNGLNFRGITGNVHNIMDYHMMPSGKQVDETVG